MNFDNVKIHASSVGKIMTDPRAKSETLSKTCKSHLLEVAIEQLFHRKKEVFNKAILKGLQVEEDSLTLYSLVKMKAFFKNKEQLSNDFITGTPDIITDYSVTDIKSSYDIFTFFNNRDESELNQNYYWQLQSYMALTGRRVSTLAYCLVNTPELIINDEKRKLMWKMNVSDTDESFEAACDELDKLMIYDDVPQALRVIEITIPRNDTDIERIYERVKQCREYMNESFGKY